MATKYTTYKYTDKASLVLAIANEGCTFEGDLTQGHLIHTETGIRINYVFWNSIVLNYPQTYIEDEDPDNPSWTPQVSTDCYINLSCSQSVELPASNKLSDNDRNYFKTYINSFIGE